MERMWSTDGSRGREKVSDLYRALPVAQVDGEESEAGWDIDVWGV